MTITSTVSRMPPYAGNGSATAFPVSIPFPDADSIRAILARPGQTDAELVRDTDFTLIGAGDPAGGTLTFPKAGSAYSVLASGETLHILRVLPLTQERDWDNVDALDAEQIEAGDDRLTMLCQQLQEQLDRAVQWPATGAGETDAATWLGTATAARDQAVAAQAAAEAAEVTALAAQAGAQAAQSAAGLAETGAAASASAAQATLAATVSARDAALAAQSGAATERAAAQTARTGAETARDAALAAQAGAVTAQAGAVAARTGAETARDAAADSAGIAANWAAVVGATVGDYGSVTEPEGETYDYGGVI